MTTSTKPLEKYFPQLIDLSLRVGVVLTLLVLSYQILRPFLFPVIWGVILAVAVFPGFSFAKHRLGERPKIAALLVSVMLLLILVVPSIMLANSLYNGVQLVRAEWEVGFFEIPSPPADVKTWPLVGEKIYELWQSASVNLLNTLEPIRPQLRAAAHWLLEIATGGGFTFLQFIFSIIVAGILLANSAACQKKAYLLSHRLSAERGVELLRDAETTIRSVAKGILGVAFIQSVLAGIGFAFAGVPGAGLWALVCLIFGIIQIGVAPVMLLGVLYLFSTADSTTASLFLVWTVFVAALDNVLKPLLLGQGAPVPMIVIFLGALGGFLRFGLIGLFVGAIILSVAYKLFISWLKEPVEDADVAAENTARFPS